MAVEDSSTKRCAKCGEIKPHTEFYRHKRTKDGLDTRCKACNLSLNAEWRAANKENVRARRAIEYAANREAAKANAAAWRAANLDRARATSREYHAKNKGKVRQQQIEWRKANHAKRLAQDAARRARKRGTEGTYTAEQIEHLYAMQRGRCALCGGKLGRAFHRDHIMPLALDGTNDISNIQLLCPSCNCRKNAKHPIDYAQQIGKLL